MTVLIAAETVLLMLLSLLVAGLLRSHAEILRRLAEESPQRVRAGIAIDPGGPPLPVDSGDAAPARPVVGVTLNGEPTNVEFGAGAPGTLLAFLSSGCASCRAFWDAFSSRRRDGLLRGLRLVIVTESPESESLAGLRKLAPRKVPVILSSRAWKEYGVPGSPYFVYVRGGSDEVAGEGAAGDWAQLRRLVEDALADAELAENGGTRARAPHLSDSHPERIREADRTLLAAGIGPDHPSLWPVGKPSDTDSTTTKGH